MKREGKRSLWDHIYYQQWHCAKFWEIKNELSMVFTPKKFNHNSACRILLWYHKSSQLAVHILKGLNIELRYDWLEY